VQIRIDGRVEEVRTVEELEQLCKKLREELQGSGCQYHSWYIRVPPDRLLAILRKAFVKYSQGVLAVGEVISEYLEENKLSKSLSRVITPTLSSLGLMAGGKFTAAAVELGRLLAEGRSEEAFEKLRQLVMRNCVLREVVENVGDCAELEKVVASVLAAYGKSVRFDELKYTAELIKLIEPRCSGCEFKCVTPEKIAACTQRLVQIATPHMRELFEKLDISLLPEHLDYVQIARDAYSINVKGTAKQIGMLLIAEPVETAEPQRLKNTLAKLDEKIVEGIYEVYVKIVPIIEGGGGGCRSLKLLVEVVRGDLERASKLVKASS